MSEDGYDEKMKLATTKTQIYGLIAEKIKYDIPDYDTPSHGTPKSSRTIFPLDKNVSFLKQIKELGDETIPDYVDRNFLWFCHSKKSVKTNAYQRFLFIQQPEYITHMYLDLTNLAYPKVVSIFYHIKEVEIDSICQQITTKELIDEIVRIIIDVEDKGKAGTVVTMNGFNFGFQEKRSELSYQTIEQHILDGCKAHLRERGLDICKYTENFDHRRELPDDEHETLRCDKILWKKSSCGYKLEIFFFHDLHQIQVILSDTTWINPNPCPY